MLDQELSNVFWSFAILGVKNIAFLDRISHEMLHPRILPAFTSQALSNILVACARLEYKNKTFLNAFLEESTRPYRLQALEEHHIANMTWALGTLRVPISQPLLDALAQECIAHHRRHKYTPNDICNILTGWAYSPECLHVDAYHTLLHQIFNPTNGLIKYFSPVFIARLVWAMGRLEYTTVDDFELVMKEAMDSIRLEKYNNQDLSNIFIGCGKRKLKDKEMLMPLLKETITPERLIMYNDQQLANITWALGEMGIRDERIFRMLARGIVESSTICDNPSQVVMVLRGWAHSDFRYQPGLVKIVTEILKPNTLSKFIPKDLRGVLWCLRSLDFEEEHLIQLLEDQLPENNKGVMARFRQRLIAQDEKKWPKLLGSRRTTP